MRGLTRVDVFAVILIVITSMSFGLVCAQEEQSVVFLNRDDPSLDSIGDPLPPRAIMRFGTLRFQNPSSVNTMMLSPDDKYLIVLTSLHLLAWETTTGKELWRKRNEFVRISGPAYGQQFIRFDKNDSEKFYLCGKDLELKVVTTATGDTETVSITRDVDAADLFRSRGVQFTSVDVDEDARQFLLGSESGIGLYDRKGAMKWYVPNLPRSPIQVGGGNRDRLDFGGDFSLGQLSPSGKVAAATMSDQRTQIKLIDLEKGEVEAAIKTTAKPVRFAFSPDGKLIYATERDCGIRCYRVKDQQQVWELPIKPDPKGAESYASAIACSSDGKLIAAGVPVGPKDWVYLVDTETGREVAVLKSCGWKPWAVQFSSDNSVLYVSGWSGTIKRWDVEAAKAGDTKPLRLPEGVRGSSTVAFSPKGKHVAFRDGDGKVRVIDQKTGVQKHKLSIKGSGVLLFSPDGRRLFTGGTNGEKVQVNVWDFRQGKLAQSWAFEKGKDSHSDVEELATDAAGRYLAAAVFRQSAAYLWDTQSGKQIAKLNHRSVYGLAISPNGSTLITVGWDKKIKCWSTKSGELLGTTLVAEAIEDPQFAVDDPRMYGVRYSADGKRIAVAHLSGHISFWDAGDPARLKPIHQIAGSRFIFGAFDFSPDGTWVAAGKSSGAIELYDSYTGDRMLTVGSHANYVYTVRFGADHRRLATGGRGVSYVWALDEANPGLENDSIKLWNQLRDSPDKKADLSSAYQAILSLANSEEGCEFIAEKLREVKAVGSLDSLRNRDPNSPVALAMFKKAEADSTFEMSRTVHRALVALKLSMQKESVHQLDQIASFHPSKAVRELAMRIK